MDLCTDLGTSTSWDMPSMWAPPATAREQVPQEKQRTSFARLLQSIAGSEVSIVSEPPAVSALPGEAITPEVLANEEQRRTLIGIFGRFAAERQISRASMAAAEVFIEALPRSAPLPVVSPDGDGGVQMAWVVPGRPRTIASLADGLLWVVARAGTADAEYFPEVQFSGLVPEHLLQAIQP